MKHFSNTRTIRANVQYFVDAFRDETNIDSAVHGSYPEMQKHIDRLTQRYDIIADFDSIRVRIVIGTTIVEETWLDY